MLWLYNAASFLSVRSQCYLNDRYFSLRMFVFTPVQLFVLMMVPLTILSSFTNYCFFLIYKIIRLMYFFTIVFHRLTPNKSVICDVYL